MQLTPRYGDEPLIRLDGDPSAVLAPVARQRRRLAETLSTFTEEQWAHASRCEGWSNRDVISHLETTNTFWSFSIQCGLKGEPSRFLTTFDPVATPASLVAGSKDVPAADVYAAFAASSESFLGLLESLDDDGWRTLAEAPPGHLSISALAHHALWDSWIHERDILLPLGTTPDQEPDEILGSLRYVAALSPAFAVNDGSAEQGALAIDVTDPDASIVVEVGDSVVVGEGPVAADAGFRLAGDAVDLLESLSLRKPLDHPVPHASAWMLRGLATAFDVPA